MEHMTLKTLFNDAEVDTPKRSTRNTDDPTLPEIKKLLAHVEDYFYRSPLTCAKRLAVGTRFRNMPKHILDALDGHELQVLGRFSSTHSQLVNFMVKQRSEDLICSKPLYLTYDQLADLAKRADIIAGKS